MDLRLACRSSVRNVGKYRLEMESGRHSHGPAIKLLVARIVGIFLLVRSINFMLRSESGQRIGAHRNKLKSFFRMRVTV